MSLTLRIIGSIVFALLACLGILVASSHLLPILSVGLLVALAMVGLQLDNRRSASRSVRGAALHVVAAATAFVTIVYAAIGTATLLGGASPALAGASALAYLGYRWRRRRGSSHEARPVAERGLGLVERGASRGGSSHNGSPTQGSTSGSSGTATADAPSRKLLPTDPAALSIDELCRAWRVSYIALQNARTPQALEDAVQLRRRYLDELCRRHPQGFRRWLDDGARAAGDPSRYLQPRSECRNRNEDPRA